MPDSTAPVIVVTRPRDQAVALCEQLEEAGFRVITFPVIEIQPANEAEAVHRQLAQLGQFDLAIFVSANAVTSAMSLNPNPWPASLSIAAIGQATAKTLRQHQLPPDLVAPKPYNSEALLSMPALQVMGGKRVIIFRGVGGREHLAQTLRQRGANVEYAECYRRVVPECDTSPLHQAWQAHQPLLFVVTSSEGLQNLYDMIAETDRENLLSSRLVVVSERTAGFARELGFRQQPLVTDSASDEAVVTIIKCWNAGKTQP